MRKRSSKMIWLAGLALITALAGGGLAAWKFRQRQQTVYTDGATINQAANEAVVRDVLWQPPALLPETVNTDAQEYEAHLSADGLTIYFVRGKAGQNADIYSATRTSESSEQWNTAQPLSAINTDDDELGPAPSPDGRSLYFYSNRAGGQGGYDLWVAHRDEQGDWQSPVNLGQAVNTEFNEYGPAIAPDGSSLYFSSNRPQPGDTNQRAIGAWPATVREDRAHRDYDLYSAAIVNGELQTAAPIDPLNSIHNEGAPCLSPAGDFLYFCSDRPGGQGGFDLYRARRLHGKFLRPMNLGSDVNSSANELDPAIGMGGFGLHFSSDRAIDGLAANAVRDYNLYHTTSREVFTQVEAGGLLDWRVLGPLIGRSLLWLLLALLILLLIRALLKSVRSRKLSLLTRCLMVSLLAHLILMVMLTFWQVTTSLAGLIDRNSGGTKIALTSAAGGNELFTQIRGDLTQIAFASVETTADRGSVDLPPSSPPLVNLAAESPKSEFHEQPSLRAQSNEAPIQPSPPPALRDEAPIDKAWPVEMNVPAAAARIAAAEATPAAPRTTDALTSHERDSAATAVAQLPHASVAIQPSPITSNPPASASLASSPAVGESSPTAVELPKPLLADAGPMDLATATYALATPQAQPPKRVSERAAESPAAAVSSAAHAAISTAPAVSPTAITASLAPTKLSQHPGEKSTIKPDNGATDSTTVAVANNGDVNVQNSDATMALPDATQTALQAPSGPQLGTAGNELDVQITARNASGQASARIADDTTVGPPATGDLPIHIAPSKAKASSVEKSCAIMDQAFLASSQSQVPHGGSQSGAKTDLRDSVPPLDGVAESQLATPADARPGTAAHGEASVAVASVQIATSRPVLANGPQHPEASAGVHFAPSRAGSAAAEGPLQSKHRDFATAHMAETGQGISIAEPSPDVAVMDTLATTLAPMAIPKEGQSAHGESVEGSVALTGIDALTLVSRARTTASVAGPGAPTAIHLQPSTLQATASASDGSESQIVMQLAKSAGDAVLSISGDESPPDLNIALPAAALGAQLSNPAEGRNALKEGNLEALAGISSINTSTARSNLSSSTSPRPLSQTAIHLSPVRESTRATEGPLGAGPSMQPGAHASDSIDHGAGLAAPSIDVDMAMLPASVGVDLHIPTELPPANPYVQRTPEKRLETVKRMGGSEATEKAVALALKWLAAHQNADGRWAAKHFDDDCGECGGAAKFDTDIAATGLSLLCFLAADHTHFKDGPYREQVKRGLQWLVAQQKADGDFRGNETMYSHGIATIAISEAYGMTSDPELVEPLKSAIQFICDSRNRRVGGWRYEPGQAGDTSVLGWQVMALVSAKRLGISAPEDAFDAARQWLETVTVPTKPGLYAYQPGQRHSPSMTAEGLFVQQLLGAPHDDPKMLASIDYVLQNPPRWRGEPNTYYWYYATLALFQEQGKQWETWNRAITEQLLNNQNTSGAQAGSWDPVDNWSKIGGRIYQTAICTLSLEVYYRYLPMYAAAGQPAAP